MSQKPDDTIVSANKEHEELVERARSGDEAAFLELCQSYSKSIVHHFRGFSGDKYDAEDLVQDTLIRALRELGENLDIRLRSIAQNSAIEYLQSKRKFSQEEEQEIESIAEEVMKLYSKDHNLHEAALRISQQPPTDTFILRISIEEEPLTAQSFSAIIAAITDLYTRCWLIQQKQFSDLMDYAQTRDPLFVKEANLRVGTMYHNSPAIFDFLLNTGGIAGGAATLVLTLSKAIDAVAQAPLRFEATKLKNQREKQEQEIQGKQAELERQITTQRAETEDKGKQQEQQLDAERKLLELERQRMLLEIEKQKLEVEVEKQRTALDRERLEFEKNRVIIVQEIAVTMVGQLLSSEDREDAGRTEMLVHSLIPSLLQLAATDAVVTAFPLAQLTDENKGSSEEK